MNEIEIIQKSLDNNENKYDIFKKIYENYNKYGYVTKEECKLALLNIFDINFNIDFDLDELFSDNTIYELKEKRVKQETFRKNIINRDKKCLLSNSPATMCEVAHIIPYCECDKNIKYDVNNGLLLNAGLHKLFDKFLWSIDTNSKVVLSPKVLNDSDYELVHCYHNKVLKLNDMILKNLKWHYNKFLMNK